MVQQERRSEAPRVLCPACIPPIADHDVLATLMRSPELAPAPTARSFGHRVWTMFLLSAARGKVKIFSPPLVSTPGHRGKVRAEIGAAHQGLAALEAVDGIGPEIVGRVLIDVLDDAPERPQE